MDIGRNRVIKIEINISYDIGRNRVLNCYSLLHVVAIVYLKLKCFFICNSTMNLKRNGVLMFFF